MNACPNCGTAVAETYCPTCGQKYEDERFTLASVLSTALKEVTDLKSGVLATIVGLSWTPGRVVRNYWARRTKPYLNPAKYYLFALTVFQLVLWQTGLAEHVVGGFLEAWENVSVSRARALRFFGDYFALFFAAGLPFLTVASYWGTKRNLAEHTIFHLYASGQVALLWSFSLIATLLPIPKIGYLALPATIAYYVWVYVAAHRPDTGHSLGREIAQIVGVLVAFGVLYILVFGISFAFFVPTAGSSAP